MKNSCRHYENEIYKNSNWIKQHWIEVLIFAGGLVAVNLILIDGAYFKGRFVSPELASKLGDFVGGYVGTIFALVSVLLLVSTLKNQSETSTIEKFETKYFELIKMHRDNVAEIGIGDDFGKKIFVILIREFREIHEILKASAALTGESLTPTKLFIVAYYGLYYGVGPNSSRILESALQGLPPNLIKKFIEILSDPANQKSVKNKRGFKYTPFEGHQSRLGHYYRHLYQSIDYVDRQSDLIDKYSYVKTMRAQLTTHEQALLFINSLTPMGNDWWKGKLIVRYRLAQNVPEYFFNSTTEIDMKEFFPSKYFEWQEKRATLELPLKYDCCR